MSKIKEQACERCLNKVATRTLIDQGLNVCEDCYYELHTCNFCGCEIDHSDFIYDDSGNSLCIDCRESEDEND